MEKTTRLRVLGTLTVAGVLALSGGPAMAGESHRHKSMAYTCTGGEIPSGNYARITVTGACEVAADAVIRVRGNVYVAAGAVLDAQRAPSTLTVDGNVTGAWGSTVGLGCQPPSATGNSAHECELDPEGQSTITIKGNVTAVHALLVQLNGITVRGNVTLVKGGGPNYWSIKNNTIGRNLTVSGQTVAWLGVLFNEIGRNARLTNITVIDEHPGAPGVFVVRNTVGRNLSCWGLVPGVSGGFDPTAVNVVGRHATGQCAALV
ncbi:MAG TPA: hypothetical protein VES93_06155 [Ornithinibacter sp.]|nr:hypothetical protein [Ornithinibacter sp.]